MMRCTRLSSVATVVVALATFTCVIVLVTFKPVACERHEKIFLPPDADTVTISGNGFELTLKQLQTAQQEWGSVAKESADVVVPREIEANQKVGHTYGGSDGATQTYKVITNENLAEQAKAKGGVKSKDNFGEADEALLEWIIRRATSLINKVERYKKEAQQALITDTGRIVLNILMLNTLVDVQNLNQENIDQLRWIKNKLNVITRDNSDKSHKEEVLDWAREVILRNKNIENKTLSKNDPGSKWITNTQGLARVLREQRFSQQLGDTILGFMSEKFAFMPRMTMFDVFNKGEKLDDGLKYPGIKHHVPSSFPFSAQGAIMNGDMI